MLVHTSDIIQRGVNAACVLKRHLLLIKLTSVFCPLYASFAHGSNCQLHRCCCMLYLTRVLILTALVFAILNVLWCPTALVQFQMLLLKFYYACTYTLHRFNRITSCANTKCSQKCFVTPYVENIAIIVVHIHLGFGD